MPSDYPRIAVIHHLDQPFLGNAREPLGPVAEYFDGLPDLDEVDAIVSFGGAQDAWEPQYEPERELIREAVDREIPFPGVCYGHQLLAHALGGEVGNHPAGREMGTVHLNLHPTAAADPLFAGLPASFPAHATHVQTVAKPPRDATVLAKSEQDACHAFRWGERAWGVQFHPEFATHHMRGYVHARADHLRSEGRCPRSISREVTAAPQARKLLRRFVRHARGLHAR